jgi:hypothetical protein
MCRELGVRNRTLSLIAGRHARSAASRQPESGLRSISKNVIPPRQDDPVTSTPSLRRGRRPGPTGKPLYQTHIDLLSQAHPDLNKHLDVGSLSAGSHQKVWWRCLKGPDHIWQATVNSRTVIGTGCACCAGRQVSVTNSLKTRFPDIATQLDSERNQGITADRITAGSRLRVWWRCPEGPDHSWETTVANRTNSRNGCPYCSGQRLSVTNSLVARFPEVADQLDPDRNGGLTADRVLAGSTIRLWWRCPAGPDHRWQAKVFNRTAAQSGCPKCAPSGFDSSASAFVYLLSHGYLRKVGITNRPKVRLGTHCRNGWRVLETSPALDGIVAYRVEQNFLAILRLKGLRHTRGTKGVERFDGYTESWVNRDLPVETLADLYAIIGWTPGRLPAL